MVSKEEGTAADDNGSNKRIKMEVLPKDVLSGDLLQKDTAALKQEYMHDAPYPYGHIPNIFQADFLKQVIKEIKDNSVVNFKESDLFKVFQSIDLANLQDEPKMPAVMQLRSVLYSTEWRHWMEALNDLAPNTLSEKVDCACNCHMGGCHLLCHDDVIGTRKISYILYLTEPEPEWSASEGGALELYGSTVVDNNNDTAQRRIPDTVPCKALLPVFNHMAFFVVEPGFSFHAVQEVLGDRPRLSLQGWYHAAVAPANMQDATLQRLKSYQGKEAAKEEDTEGDYETFQYSDTAEEDEEQVKSLSEVDRAYLQEYLQDTYLKDEAIAAIRNRFEQDSSVQLRNFLSDALVERLKAASTTADEKGDSGVNPTSPEYYQLGESDAWKTVGPAHKQRFLEYTPPPTTSVSTKTTAVADSVGAMLYQIRSKLLQSPAFGHFLELLTSLGLPKAHRGRVRRFRPGRDYTVAHFGLLTDTSVLDATLCFVAGKGGATAAMGTESDGEEGVMDTPGTELDEADEIWQSGDCGGFECYIAADDENEDGTDPADEYNQDDDTELLSVSASNNTLSLVYRDPGTMRFVKYVGSKAPSSRWDVAMEYVVSADDDDDDDDDADGEEEDVAQIEGDDESGDEDVAAEQDETFK
jgi:prolyl 3-hydroxylase /prolyl 3,4-dihydroxylase